MTELRIRDVDDNIIEQLKVHAKRHGRTLADQVRIILDDAVQRPRRELVDRLSNLRDSIQPTQSGMPDSTAYIREGRESRG